MNITPNIWEMAARAPHDQWVAILTGGVIVLAFIVAHLTSIVLPPVDGKAHRITSRVGMACLAAVVISGLWFLWAAYDMLKMASVLYSLGK